ncbi:hypothetical protein DL771_002789 [Monosporascus sp. 5C6A]|nr:hypothetical protein DL771_002789 [Monosporascus sp. 5C6A]
MPLQVKDIPQLLRQEDMVASVEVKRRWKPLTGTTSQQHAAPQAATAAVSRTGVFIEGEVERTVVSKEIVSKKAAVIIEQQWAGV